MKKILALLVFLVLRAMPMPDDELTLYFPVVIDRDSILKGLKKTVGMLYPGSLTEAERRAFEEDIRDAVVLKYRAYYRCMMQTGRPEIAYAVRRQILDFCNQG